MRWLVILSSVVVLMVVLRHYLRIRHRMSCTHAALLDREERMREQERLAALGAMSAGLAHEMSTPLGAVSCMNATRRKATEKVHAMIAEREPDLASDEAYLRCLEILNEGDNVIDAGLVQARNLLDQLRSYAKNEKHEPIATELHERIDGALLLMHGMLKNRIEVRREFGDLPNVVCFPVKVTQIMLNLLSNAARAMPESGVLTVSTAVEAEHAVIRVADDGEGIAPEVRDRIFEFGFTTHGDRGGSGLGLAITSELVSMHEGTIEVDSELGRGTTFTVRLPLDLDRRRVGSQAG
jgi:two-component system, NtrC family, sensor kinase